MSFATQNQADELPKPNDRGDRWQPSGAILDADQVSLITRSLIGSKSFKDGKGQTSDLGERLNDLLLATGLAFDSEFDRNFWKGSSRDPGTSENAHHAYLSEQFSAIASLASEIQGHCAAPDAREYLSEVMGTLPLEQREAATLVQFKAALLAISAKLNDLTAISSAADHLRPSNNDPFNEALAAIQAATEKILPKLEQRDLTPQLNASLRIELMRGQRLTPTAPVVASSPHTTTAVFLALISRIDALSRATSRLAIYERSQIREGRPRSALLDTLILSLTHIFLTAVGSDKSDSSLPATSTSDFINFCIDVLQHYFPAEDLAPEAFSKRWQRLRKTV